jgi:N-acetylmuramoyl-L-alanine amidase
MRQLRTACLGVAVSVAVAARAGAAPTIRAVRRITAPATTRLVVEFSEPVRYRLQRFDSRPDLGIPPRLYIDFLDTQLSETAPVSIELAEGPLLRLRAVQGDTGTRLILDVPGLTDFGIFPMPDPFRFIIDVRGAARAGAAHPSRAPAPAVASVPRPAPHEPAAPPASAATPAPRHRFKIVLDPGHGGKDPGAIGVGGVAEKDVVLAIARRLHSRLASEPDLDVVMTRDSDVFLALEERTARANTEQADLFVSIHANASPNPELSGIETYYLNNTNDHATIRLAEMENGLRSMTGHSGRDRDTSLILSDLIQSYKVEESAALAADVQHAVVAELAAQRTPAHDLGVKRGPFYVLVGAGMPCVLVEVAFLTNPEEGPRLAQNGYQDTIRDGLLRGIRRFVDNIRVAENL